MSNDKVKFYKNPNRNEVNSVKPYVPQYKTIGLTPPEFQNSETGPVTSVNAQTILRSSARVPYAETMSSPVGRGRGLLPNVGNNIEQAWPSVDGNLMDDLQLDLDQVMVDNNEMVSAKALGIEESL